MLDTSSARPEPAAPRPPRRFFGVRRRGLVTALVALPATLVMLGHSLIPDRAGHLGSLTETFLPWTGVVVPLLLVCAAVRRSTTAAAAVLLPALVWGTLYGGTLADKQASGGDLTVVTHNVNEHNPSPVHTARALAAAADASGHGHGGRWNPDPDALRFTFAVMPDTQYLYWGSQDSVNRAPQEESFRYIVRNSGVADQNIVFMSHLGDLSQDADASSFEQIDKAFDILDAKGAAYSVVAGNHDVSGDDTRGDSPYLRTLGPRRFRHAKSFLGADATGYNTAHVFRAAGRAWLVLALDWRTTEQGFAWAEKTIRAHPRMPVILTAHDIVHPDYYDNVFPYESGDPENNASLSAYGQTLWDRLIADNDQISEGVPDSRVKVSAVPGPTTRFQPSSAPYTHIRVVRRPFI